MASRGTVLVGMSGGVDSSVTATLLVEQGYEVVGSHMKLVHLTMGGVDHGCCGPDAREDARAVAAHLGVPFEVHDVSEAFEETVIDDFFSEHAAGRTPNPCARCNEHIKFGAFLARADALGCAFVATGHYVRASRGDDGAWELRRAVDASKDQSYVLHMLGQEQLARSLFPLGAMTKAQTRAAATRLGLDWIANKPDSQEVCFVPNADHAAFIEEFVPRMVREGELVDPEGNVVGHHRGAFRYTIGQRRGLGVSTGVPNYVLDIDASANRVVIGPGDLLARRRLSADRLSWIAGTPPTAGPFEADAQIRYRGRPASAVVRVDGDRCEVEFRSPQRAVAPGQSVVFSRGDRILGGGRILEAR
jgi:tRNA-specific 2-thiouridylase